MSNEALFARVDENDADTVDIRDQNLEKYLIFHSNGIYYGVSANLVKEILTEVSVTNLPRMPEHVLGVFNLRGQIVSAIDYRILLGQEAGASECAMVVDIEDNQIGVLVDDVDKMVDIDRTTIVPVPYQSSNESQRLITGMCSLPTDNLTVMIVDFSLLLHE